MKDLENLRIRRHETWIGYLACVSKGGKQKNKQMIKLRESVHVHMYVCMRVYSLEVAVKPFCISVSKPVD